MSSIEVKHKARKETSQTNKRGLPNLPKEHVVGILLSDIHLSHTPPIARSIEPDWYAAMQRPLDEVYNLQRHYNCPVLCAGDIFHKPNPPPELINFALSNLPEGMICVPGQHDLPFHNYEDMFKGGYGTLTLARTINNIISGVPHDCGMLTVHGFPWEHKVHPLQIINTNSLCLHIALVHQYIWKDGYVYHPDKAPPEQRVSKMRKKLTGYDLAVFGDNHLGFYVKPKREYCGIVNCGALMRRDITQIDYEPTVGLLCADKRVIQWKLDCSKDKMLDPKVVKDTASTHIDMDEFIEELASLGKHSLDFYQIVKHHLEKYDIREQVKNLVLNALGEKE